MYKKNGRIPWSDSKLVFISTLIFFFVGVADFSNNIYLSTTCIILGVFHFFRFVYPFTEKFMICDNTIYIKKMFSTTQKHIPSNCVLIVSKASVHLLLEPTESELKGKYAVSIIECMPINEILTLVRGKQPSQVSYSNCTIESALKYRFIYSFVIEEDSALMKLLDSTDSTVIIPESIMNRMYTKPFENRLYIDIGW